MPATWAWPWWGPGAGLLLGSGAGLLFCGPWCGATFGPWCGLRCGPWCGATFLESSESCELRCVASGAGLLLGPGVGSGAGSGVRALVQGYFSGIFRVVWAPVCGLRCGATFLESLESNLHRYLPSFQIVTLATKVARHQVTHQVIRVSSNLHQAICTKQFAPSNSHQINSHQ
jgi:hypothetical protein